MNLAVRFDGEDIRMRSVMSQTFSEQNTFRQANQLPADGAEVSLYYASDCYKCSSE